MSEQIVFDIKADISQFEHQMTEISNSYEKTKRDIENKQIETAPLSSSETKNETRKSYGYMFKSFDQMRESINEVSSMGTDLPGEMVQAISTLTTGMRLSLKSLQDSLKTAGKTMKDAFDPNSFNNGIRYQATTLTQYARDMREASKLANQMTTQTRSALGSNTRQLLSLVSPAIAQISGRERKALSDVALRGRMQGEDFSYISKFLDSIGVKERAEQQKAIDFAIKTSNARIHRADAADAYNYARMRGDKLNISVTDQFRDTYRTPFLTGGRFISEAKTPTNTAKSSRQASLDFYKAIQQEILHGNNVAFKAADAAGLISIDRGQFSFAKAGTVLKNKAMLDHFAGLVVQEAKRASQGSPQHFKNVNDPYNEQALLEKDNIALREARRLIAYDSRPDANPYLVKGYRTPEHPNYEVVKHTAPELKIGESINIPRMTVQYKNGNAQFMVSRKKDGKTTLEPNIDFNWKKNGVIESVDDEFISMGRNPILDRLMRLHPGTKFENRGFGYDFDSKDKAKGGRPLVIDMPISSFYKKDTYGGIDFQDGQTGRTAKFEGNAEELIHKLYTGELRPVLNFGNEKIAYRAFAGKLEGGGSMKFMQAADYDELVRRDKARGVMPMLDYFNEVDKNGRLINPNTGKGYINTSGSFTGDMAEEAKDAVKTYARFFDARNKILSHSVPIEELGGKTPLAALINFDPFYRAAKYSKNDPRKFDGGAFIDPTVFDRDFQARMGPAKFLAQRFDWRQWFLDSGLTYTGQDKKQHFYMPGMSVTDPDEYLKFKEEQERYLSGKMSQKERSSFEQWRDERFVDIMDEKYGILMSDTALKSVNKLGFITPEQYAEIASVRNEAVKNGSIQNTSFTDKNRRAAGNGGMIPLTPAQQTELMGMMSDKDEGIGLRMMKDTENYYGEKDFWSPAYMSSVVMTPTMMRRSTENYRKAFNELSTPEGIIKRMFSGSDMDSMRVKLDPRLIYTDSDIRAKVQRQIADLESKQIEGYGYFPGMSQMLLAGVNPSAPFGEYGSHLMNRAVEGDAAKLIARRHGVIAPEVPNGGYTNWTRSPYAPGASFFADSISAKAAQKYKLSNNIALFNPEDFYQLNTGDFDGDFVWAYQALKEDQDFVRMTEERNRAVAEYAKKRQEDANRRKDLDGTEQAVQYQHDAADFEQAVLRTTNSINPIGVGYKLGQAGRVLKLSAEELQVIDDYANEVYGAAIDQKKDPNLQIREATGVLKDARNSRQPFDRLVEAIMEEAGTEVYGGTDIFKYALPTYFDPLGASMLSGALAGRSVYVDYGKKFASALRSNVAARYENRTDEERDLAKWYQDILIGKMTGGYQITTQDQLEEGYKRVAALRVKGEALKEKDATSKEAEDMLAMASRAEKAIKTEEVMGFTEGQLGNIERYYAFNRWRNPVSDGFRNKISGDAAILFQEEARQRQEEAILQSQMQAVDEVISNASGRHHGPSDRDNIYSRILTANRFTGFNYSNSKYWTQGNQTLEDAIYSSLSGENASTGHKLVSKYQEEEKEYNQKEKIARHILTGETDSNADAIIGSAAHAFMDKYGAIRSSQRTNGNPTTEEDRKEAQMAALEAFEDVLFGDKNAKDREIAGVTFEKSEYKGSYVANMQDAEKAKSLTEGKLSNVIQRLNNVVHDYYDRTLEATGPDRMIMTEGVMFDDQGNQISSRRNEGGNGIWIEPTRDGQYVLPFTRKKRGSDGRLEEKQAGFYFTPDMVKKNANGEITIADWKSSASGQQDAIFQMAFYAHQMEELGKRYWNTDNEQEKKDLEWFSQFVTKQKDGSFTSNIKALEAVNLFGKKNESLLTQNYTMEMGDRISKWMEQGMTELAKSANLGFMNELPGLVIPLLARKMPNGRSTIAPGEKEEDFAILDEQTIASINAEMDRMRNIRGGGTGIRDKDGNFIDTDKSFLVANFMKEQEELRQIGSFVSKENRRLFNKGIYTQDEYTQNIEQLKSKFDEKQYEAIQKYLGADAVAPDMSLLEDAFTANQVEAVNRMKDLMTLRQEYVKQLPLTMKTDYDAIKFNGKDFASQLMAATYKRKRDISALQGSYETNPYYDYEKKGFKLTEDQYYIYPGDKKEGESDADYAARLEKAQKDAQTKVADAQQEMSKYNTQLAQIEAAYTDFSDSWVERLAQRKETEGNALLSVFSGETIEKTAFDLRREAKRYEQMASQGSGEGDQRVYEYSLAERKAMVAEQERLEEKAKLVDSLKGTPLENLAGYRKEFSKARIESMMYGTAISPDILKKKAMGEFVQQYLAENNEADINELNAALAQFGTTYQARQDQQLELQTLATSMRNDATQRQREQSYWQYDRNRYANPSRFAQFYYQQQDRKFQLQEQRNNARDSAALLSKQLNAGMIKDPAQLADAQAKLAGYKKTMADADAELQKFSGGQNLLAAGIKTVDSSLSMLFARFGRQLFSKALQEAKRFVQDFNKQMTTIQMITLKSDSEMSNLGEGLINRAKELKISISEISQSAATLYRQGLTDEQVNERLDVISKFSKVSGANVADATKLITVAINTGLVTDPRMAADIVTALGDNAATNAQQIEKGIEKAGAAAAADGTSFGELAAMLTAITSTTQIGGNVAGRTLNTIFGRMNKIGTNELIYDENGHAISGSAVAKLLEAQGIQQYENGQKKSSYQTLYELSQKWDNLSDAEQQQLANAIAGTRQYSNFSAIMQGMSEGKVDEYMQLIGDASGITDRKYEIYTKSLEASLTNLRNTFDQLVADLTNNGDLSGFIDTIANMIQGVDSLTKSLGGLGGILSAVLPLFIGFTMLKAGIASMNLPMILGGAALAIGTGVSLDVLGSNKSSASQQKEEYDAMYKERISKYDGIERLKTLRSKTDRTTEENEEYATLINKYAKAIGLTNSSSDAATYSIENLTKAISSLSSEANNAADSVIKEVDEEQKKEFANRIMNTRGSVVQSLSSDADAAKREADKLFSIGNDYLLSTLYKYDADKGKYVLREDALSKQADFIDKSHENEGIINKILYPDAPKWNDIKGVFGSFYYSAAQNGFLGDEAKSYTPKQWENLINSGAITQEQLENAFKFYENQDLTNSNQYEARLKASKATLTELLGGLYDSEQIDYLAQRMATTWHRTNSSQEGYNSIVGTGATYEEITSHINGVLSGMPKTDKQNEISALARVGLNYPGESGYFYDVKNGRFVSKKEAQRNVDNYNRQYSNQTIGKSVVGVGDDSGIVFGTYNGTNMTTAEAQRQAEANREYFYYLDENGNKVYRDSKGNLITSQAQADKAAEEYANTQATWSGSFSFKNKTYKATGTKDEVRQQLEEQRKQLLTRAYSVNYTNGDKVDLTFASKEEAQAYADELNAQELARFQNDLHIARINQRANTRSEYRDLYGNLVTKYGANAEAEIEKLRQKEIDENPFVILDQNGKVIGTFTDEQEAKNALAAYTEYWDMDSDNLIGVGQEGLEKVNALKMSLDYYADGKFIGSNVEGKTEAERLKSYRYQYTDLDGTVRAFEELEDAEKSANLAEQDLKTRMNMRYNDLVQEFGVRGVLDEQGRDALLWDRVLQEYDNELKNFGDGAILPYQAPIISTSQTPHNISEITTAQIYKAEEIIEALQTYIPDLKGITPAKIASVYGELPTEVQTMIDEIVRTGKATTEIIDDVNDALANLEVPEYKEIYNRFSGSAATGYTAWQQDSKTQLSLLMDEATEAVIASGVLGMSNNNNAAIQKLVKDINWKDNKQWESLVQQSPDFARIVSQVQLDEAGNVISAPEDIIDQMATFLFKNGRDFGQKQTTLQERANRARKAYIGLTQEDWYTSFDAAQRSMDKQYQDTVVQPFEDYWSKRLERATIPEVRAQEEQAYARQKSQLQTFDEYLKENNISYMSDLDNSYLTEILGEDLANRVKTKQGLRLGEAEYANLLLSNAQFGISGLTAGQKVRGIADLRKAISQGTIIGEGENQFSTNIASQYLSGWGGFNEYVALLSARALDADKFKELGGQEKLDELTLSLENFQKNAQISLEIEGIKSLEEAGKLASGTADAIEKLKRGGKFALEVEIDVRNKAFSAGQQRARLLSGSTQEQDEAIMSLLGIDKDQLYSNRNLYYTLARQQETMSREQQIASIYEEYKMANPMNRAALRSAAEALGYSLNLKGYTDLGTPEIQRTNYFAGQQQKYTEAQLAQARQDIFERKLTENTEGKEDLYQAAASSVGQYQFEYERMLYNSTHGGNVNEADLERARNLAKQEAELSAKEAGENEELELARLGSNSLGGMFRYQNVQQRQENKAAESASKIFDSLSKIDPNSSNAFTELINSVNGEQANNWKDLIESSPDLAKKLSDLGVTVDGDNLDFSGLKNSTVDVADVLTLLKEAASGAADALNEFKEVSSVGETFEQAMDYLNGSEMVDTAKGLESLESVFGNQNLAQVVANNRLAAGLNNPGRYVNSRTNIVMENGEMVRDENGRPITYDKFAGLSEYNRQFAEQLEENAEYGIQGLTEMQRLEQLQKIMDAANNGGLAELRNQDKIGQFEDVTSGIEDFDKWEHAVEAIQNADLSLSDFTVDSKEFKKAIESTGISVEDFANINEDMAKEIRAKSITALKLFGKESENVADTYMKLSGTVQEQLEVEKQMTKNRLNLANSTYYTSGAGSKDYKKVAKDFLGYSKEELEALEKQEGKEGAKIKIKQQAELQLEVDQQQVINDANAVIQNVIDNLGTEYSYDDIEFLVGGTYDISQLAAMAADAEGAAKEILNALIDSLKNMEGSVTFNAEATGDGHTIKISSSDVHSVGGGHRTGGGGGGGGKSEIDKMLEQQKSRISAIQHNINMLQTAGTTYDFINDYQAQIDNINQQISAYEELRAAYAQNIAELQAQLATVEAGSEDWIKLTDAIHAAQEAMAGITNTINQLNSSKITIIEQKQAYKRGPKDHKGTILEARAQRYQMTGQFEAYETTIQQSIANDQSKIKQNEKNIKEWEDLLKETIKGSDDWYKIREKIWKAKEENEQLQNDVIAAEIELEKARIDQIANELQNNNLNYQHLNNIMATYAGIYQQTNNFDKYRDAIQQQTTNLEAIKKANAEAIAKLKEEIENMEEDDPARQHALEVLYGLEEQQAQIDAQLLENQASIEQSYISEIDKIHEQQERANEHEAKLLDEALHKYERDDDFANANNIYLEKIRNTEDAIAENQAKLNEYLELMNSGKIQEGTQAWLDLQAAINAVTETIANLTNTAADLEQQRLLNVFGHIQSEFRQGNNEYYSGTYGNQIYEGETEQEVIDKIREAKREDVRNRINQLMTQQHDRRNERQNIIANMIQEQERLNTLGANKTEVEDEITRLQERLNSYTGPDGKPLFGREKEEGSTRFSLQFAQQQLNDINNEIASIQANLQTEQQAVVQADTDLTAIQNDINAANQDLAAIDNSEENVVHHQAFAGMDQLQHENKLIDYQISKYQNRGELTNVGRMYEYKNERLQQEREQYALYIQALQEYQDTVTDYPEVWHKVEEEIRNAEESLASVTNEIEANNEAIRKNQEAIRQARIKVENEAERAIKAIIQKEKNMLSATVSMQNTILDVIRNTYKEQWDLEKKTIEKKKQALNEEKNLINERLNLRKQALDEETKQEELAEYKRQLALISADTTRTKEANELRRKIAEMERDEAFKNAQDLANAEVQAIDDRIEAWNNYVTVHEEDLNNLLADSKNFTEVLDQLLTGSYEDFIAWNMKYNKAYRNATEEQRKQMEQGWDDTWLNMLGKLRLYWDDVESVMQDKDSFMALVTSLDDYQKLSDTEKQSYLYKMGELWDSYQASLVDNAAFDDTGHEVLDKIDELKDWTFSVKIVETPQYVFNPATSQYEYKPNTNPADPVSNDNYSGWGVDAPSNPAPSTTPDPGTGGGGGSGSGSSGYSKYVADGADGHHLEVYDGNGNLKSKGSIQKHVFQGAITNGSKCTVCGWQVYQYSPTGTPAVPSGTAVIPHETTHVTSGGSNFNVPMTKILINKYADGGLVDYTGFAWVDGTPAKPEAYLKAKDTKLLRAMLDSFDRVTAIPYMTRLDDNNFSKGGINVGDINVTLNEAKLEKDADYDYIARKVGNAFTKELQKNGFNLAQYAW